MKFILYRKDKTDALKVVAELDSTANHFEDKSVVAGVSYRYFLATGSDDAPNIALSVTIIVPKDYVVSGENTVRELRGFNRLVLVRGGVLRTLGQDLSIEVNEIISDGGVISTFSENAKAPLGQSGRAGGSVRIVARRGSGQLVVQASGESGGDGRDGENGPAGTTGGPGQPGDWGMNPTLYTSLDGNYLDSFARSMRQFPRPPKDSEWKRALNGIPFYVCARPPTAGETGGNGGPAQDGGSGGAGGDSGKVYVQILEDSEIQVRASGEVGLPGLGGRPGKGGLPGNGGPPGQQDQGHSCAPAQTGPTGQGGLEGRQGIPGTSGTRQPFCIKIWSRSYYDCDKFQKKEGGNSHI